MAAAAADVPLTIPVFTSKEEMRAWSRQQKREGKTVGFVPTMVRMWLGEAIAGGR